MPKFHTSKRTAASKSGAGKLSPQRLATMEKRAEATRLRVAGRTFTQIGEALGVTTGRAYQLVDEALYATLAAPAESLRQIELVRLDQLQTAVYRKAVGGDHRAAGLVLKIMARRAKLTGLDAAQPVPQASPARDDTAGDAYTLRADPGSLDS
jgi:hypothetical protein